MLKQIYKLEFLELINCAPFGVLCYLRFCKAKPSLGTAVPASAFAFCALLQLAVTFAWCPV